MAKTKLGFEVRDKGLIKKSSKKNTIPAINARLFLLKTNHFFICFIERTKVNKKRRRNHI
jgi:hypothetical protein